MGFREGQLPRDLGVLRDLARRVRRLEMRRSVTIGPWTLIVDPDTGHLDAIHRPTGQRHEIADLDAPHPYLSEHDLQSTPIEEAALSEQPGQGQ